MPQYLYPGVYIEEVSSGARPIEAVGTSTAAFVGQSPVKGRHTNKAVWINNWTQFTTEFVLADEEESKPDAKPDGEPDAKPAGEPDAKTVASTPLSHAVYGFFLNGGGRCCVVNIDDSKSIKGKGGKRGGIDLLEESDEIAIVAAPGFTDPDTHKDLVAHCELLGNRVAILDAPAKAAPLDTLTKDQAVSDKGFAARYFPHIRVADPFSPSEKVTVAPSGHIAGIYARTDQTRGVHKAPANEVIRGALDVSYRLTRDEQGALNPNGVNAIRYFPGEGIRVYGARTISPPSQPEWKYLNVRRLLIMIEESISRSTRWAVFEPNDVTLWKALRRDVSAFLTSLWRQGALMGSSPEAAFFVKCDEETNPQEEIDLGRVFILVGVAPVKPAEFVIFRIGQSASGSEAS